MVGEPSNAPAGKVLIRLARLRLTAAALAALALILALLVAVAGPTDRADATVAPLAVTVPAAGVLVLPAHDGFRDTAPIRLTAGAAWRVDVTAQRLSRTVVVARGVQLKATGAGGYATTVRAAASSLARGSWTIGAERSGHPATRATAARALRVGSGVASRVTIASSARTFYPYRDGYRETASVTVTARDETGTALPFSGSARVTAHGVTRSVAVASASGRAATGGLSVAGLPLGSASLTGSARGPAGSAHTSAAVTLALLSTGVTKVTVRPSIAEVQPVIDGRADTVAIAVGSTTSTGRTMAVAGRLEVVGASGAVRSWSLTTSAPKSVTWDGRIGGRVVPGTYTLSARMKGPQGSIRVAAASLAVSSEHLPYRVRTLFALAPFTGNQQGLAEHAGTVYVAADLGADGTRIDLRSRASGALIRSIGPLRLGHAAEISVGSDGLLYVVNGGPATDTKVFVIDPDSGRLLRTLDVSRLGVSGLLATDPGADRLLVYSETADGYRVTPVDLQGHTVGPAVPLPDEGVPQGLEIVHGELWLYTSPPTGNRITRFDPATGRLLGTIELAMSGEGEGLAVDAASGEVLVGAHGPSRVGILEAVPDE